ncbi:MAG: tRNA (adenosine(37)-N6)-threonylcarbamoyltransferase complex transferase subunit TsaD [Candidatus Dadabacteria bacterium]|nr:MAG: tRNA (adenosine(37)-N6)-threonylcarbamoyltransferase complex transferase subunit TsaD [Candidatus Dadabacteria bacterium]
MNVVAIETSCDETALALLRFDDRGKAVVCDEKISSQTDLHKLYGGVVPELASRSHLKNLPVLYRALLDQTGIKEQEIDLLAVTRGPGLKGCLLMGVDFVKGLALGLSKPFIGVNHIEGHIFSVMLDNPELNPPFLALVVSGGHTEIHMVLGLGCYQLIARTVDDAAGEAFDKSANLLGFEYPGGAALARLADSVNSTCFELPRVMREAEGFSFSGLKTAISLLIRDNEKLIVSKPEVKAELAHAIQEAIVDALTFKLLRAVKTSGCTRVAVSGGVSANKRLRRVLKERNNLEVYFPEFKHTGDNAAMIGFVGGLRFLKGEQSRLDMEVLSRFPVEKVGAPG